MSKSGPRLLVNPGYTSRINKRPTINDYVDVIDHNNAQSNNMQKRIVMNPARQVDADTLQKAIDKVNREERVIGNVRTAGEKLIADLNIVKKEDANITFILGAGVVIGGLFLASRG